MTVVVGVPTVTEVGAARASSIVEMLWYGHGGLTPRVVDNGGYYSRAAYARTGWVLPAERSVAASWNALWRTSQSAPVHNEPLVVLLNDDVEIDRPSLEELILHARLSRQRRLNGRGPLELIGAEPHPFACFVLTDLLVDRVGLFDENFAPAYYEDTDYEIRLKKAGGVVRTVDVGVKHSPATSSKDLGRSWEETAKDSKVYFEKKWGSRKRPFALPFNGKEHKT